MSSKRPRKQRPAQWHSGQGLEPQWFIELRPFTTGWQDLRLDDDDLQALQNLIMLNPQGHPVVQGTGGLRKLRFAPLRWKTGKSGAVRIGYVYLQEHGVVLLVIAYSKNEKDDLAPAEKKAIRQLIEKIENEFATGIIR